MTLDPEQLRRELEATRAQRQRLEAEFDRLLALKRAAESGLALTRASARGANGNGSATVLLVEDEPEVRDLIREILELHGYTVLQARDGGGALALSRSHPGPVHLVIADVVSRGRGGDAVIQRLIASRPEACALYISGYLEDTVAERGARHNGRFLQKPFTVDALVRKVREVLGGPATPRPS